MGFEGVGFGAGAQDLQRKDDEKGEQVVRAVHKEEEAERGRKRPRTVGSSRGR